MCAFSMSSVLFFSFRVLPLQCFALVRVMFPFFRLMSLTFSHVSSIGLVPKSFDIDRNSAIFGCAFAMSIFSCSVEGILGCLSYRL